MIACLTGVSMYAVARGIALAALMATDSRYHVERWVWDTLPREATIASAGQRSLLPRLRYTSRVSDRTESEPLTAPYLVINGSYSQRFEAWEPERPFYDRIQQGNEYTLILRHRTTAIWWPLSMDPIFTDTREDWFTNLDKINPFIEMYQRN